MNEQLPVLHELCLRIQKFEFKERLQIILEFFLNCNYGHWANGLNMESLDDFNYDLATLDCVTYVEVVLALIKVVPSQSYAAFVAAFESMLRNIHYANGTPNFISSNHFQCIDWIENNKYLVEDITQKLSPKSKIAETVINKLGYFKQHKINKNRTQEFSEIIIKKLSPQISRVPYIETEEVLANYKLYVQSFPEYSIVNIVRPNWDLTERIGTHLNISHLGFAVKDNKTVNLSFYHATSERMKIVQETLDVYMQRQQSIPTIRGINVLAVNPGFYHAR